ncbi:hypothetical protein Ae201684_013696 [Aphanomyces euteiches]|uniref:Uncharacterized protein n=1 Tax=Aphanomyces euteiches TaxID=100861 RepID=A0A6G0WME3_9STRA|nr:hypothetical protein Ae201684_013696 [Aphanomyces euteiches]
MSFLQFVRKSGENFDLNLFVLIWKNATKVCLTFKKLLSSSRSEFHSKDLVCHAEKCVVECIAQLKSYQESISISPNLVSHEIQGLRVLIKAINGIASCFIDVMSEEEIIMTWKLFGIFGGEVLKLLIQELLDSSLQSQLKLLYEEVQASVQKALSLSHFSSQEGKLEDFEVCFTDRFSELVSTHKAPHLYVQFLLAGFARFYVKSPAQDETIDCALRLRILKLLIKDYTEEYLIGRNLAKNCSRQISIETVLLLLLDGSRSSFVAVQQKLLQYTLQDTSTRDCRELCKSIWKQAMFIWYVLYSGFLAKQCRNEQCKYLGDQFVELLVDMTCGFTAELNYGPRMVSMDLLRDLHYYMDASQKSICITRIMSVVENMCSDGPSYNFNLTSEATIDLFAFFVGNNYFLSNVDNETKTEFVDKYLLMCYECYGTAVKILSDDKEVCESDDNLWRIVDVTLLVMKAIFCSISFDSDEVHHRDSDVYQVLQMTTPLLFQIVALIAGSNTQTRRIVKTSLFLVIRYDDGLKLNSENHFIRLLRCLRQFADRSTAFISTGFMLKFISDIHIPQDHNDTILVQTHIVHLFILLLSNEEWPSYFTVLNALCSFLLRSNLNLHFETFGNVGSMHKKNVITVVELQSKHMNER